MMPGETIRGLRARAGITQAELAKRLGVTPQAVSNWERNSEWPSPSNIPRLAEALAVSIDEIYQRVPQSGGPPLNLDLLQSLLRPAFELQGLTPDQARNLAAALVAEARTPPDPARGVPDELEMRIRVETLLRALARK